MDITELGWKGAWLVQDGTENLNGKHLTEGMDSGIFLKLGLRVRQLLPATYSEPVYIAVPRAYPLAFGGGAFSLGFRFRFFVFVFV